MKTTILIFGLLFAGTSFGQTESFGRWKVGSMISYDKHLSQDVFTSGKQGAPDSYYEPLICGYTPFDVNFTSGIVGQYAITKRFEVGTGIAYSRKPSYTSYFYVECATGFCGTGTLIYAPTKLNYLEVPVFARYNFLKTKLNFHVESGVTTGYLLSRLNSGSPSFNWSAQTGIGMSYTIANVINLSATTFYKRKLSLFNKLSSGFYPNSLSFELRAAYIF